MQKNVLKLRVLLITLVMAGCADGLATSAFGQKAPVAQTGQVSCWDTNGFPVVCEGTGQDGDIEAGVPFSMPRFKDNGNGTVTDKLTGLIWLKQANCPTISSADWHTALFNANRLANGQCELKDGSVAGNWRLPNLKELQSLIDLAFWSPALSNAAGTAQWMEGNAFVGVQSNDYWSSTTWLPSPSVAYVVTLHDGRTFAGNKTAAALVWPVRGGR